MITLTNKFDLPEVVVRAVEAQRKQYSKGEADFSVTELLNPPYQLKLYSMHAGEATEDVADALYAMVGSLGHRVFELAAEGDATLHEERYFATIQGCVVSGQMDLVDDREILDFKFTSVEKYMYGDHHDWESQLNMYRVLAAMNGVVANKLTIVAIFRNWLKRMKDDPKYPSYPVIKIDIPVWDKKVAWDFINERVTLHKQRRTHKLEEIRPCTDDEKWVRDSYYRAIKPGNQRATKRFDTLEEAETWLNEEESRKSTYEIEEVKGVPIRCASWCAVAEFCPEFEKWREENKNSSTLGEGWYKGEQS